MKELSAGAFIRPSTRMKQTWTRLDPASTSPSSYPNCNSNPRGTFQAQPAFGRDGVLYMALDGWDTQDGGVGGNPSIVVSRSTNLGDTWTPVVARDNRGKTAEGQEADRPVTGIAVDFKTAGSDIVYVGASRRSPGFSGANALPNQPIVVVSTDGGKSFGEPVNLAEAAFSGAGLRQTAIKSTTTIPNATTTSTTTPPAGSRAATPDQAANTGGFGPSMTVDAKGTVYAVWPTTTSNVTPRPSGAIMVSKSTDKGGTWTTSPMTTFDPTVGSFVTVAWSAEGGPQGTLHAVADGTENPAVSGNTDIYYYKSTDGGATWSARKNVTDDDPAQIFTQVYPNIAVAPERTGRHRLLRHPQRPRYPLERRLLHDLVGQRGHMVEERPDHRQVDRPQDRRVRQQRRRQRPARTGRDQGHHPRGLGRHPQR